MKYKFYRKPIVILIQHATFPRIDTGYMFPALNSGYVHVLFGVLISLLRNLWLALASSTCFPVFESGFFSRAWQRLHVSRTRHRLHIFPRLAAATYFPALGIGYMFSRAWQQASSYMILLWVLIDSLHYVIFWLLFYQRPLENAPQQLTYSKKRVFSFKALDVDCPKVAAVSKERRSKRIPMHHTGLFYCEITAGQAKWFVQWFFIQFENNTWK